MMNNNLPPGITDPDCFKATWQGRLFSGQSGIVPFINRTLVIQPMSDLGATPNRKVIWKGLQP